MPGVDMSSIKNAPMYEALKRRGFTKTSAARISNASKKKTALSTRVTDSLKQNTK
jgi:hypothetical protein